MATPPGVVTATAPVLAPDGTWVEILVGESTVNIAGVPLNVTATAPVKLAPRIVTLVPTGPAAGVTLEMLGASKKLSTLVPVPTVVVTEIGPLVAPAGTVATTCVLEVTT